MELLLGLLEGEDEADQVEGKNGPLVEEVEVGEWIEYGDQDDHVHGKDYETK